MTSRRDEFAQAGAAAAGPPGAPRPGLGRRVGLRAWAGHAPAALRRLAADLAMRSLRVRLLALLLGVGLVPTVGLGLAGLSSVAHLGGSATRTATAALRAQAQGRLLAATEAAARQADAGFAQVQTEAAVIAAQAAFIYSHPGLFPGIAQDNSALVPGPGGDLINDPTSPVGVFAPAADERKVGFWQGVALISHIDPTLRAVADAAATPPVRRFWIMTAGDMIRAIPNPGFGQPGSPVGPDRQLSGMAFYALGTPVEDPSRAARWTSPYADPAGGGDLTSAIVPVYDDSGVFHGVAGADVSLGALQADVSRLLPPPFERVTLFTAQGQVLAATPGAPTPAALGLPSGRSGGVTLGSGAGAVYAAFAPLPTAGWMLAAAVPASEILAPGDAVAAATRAAEVRVLLLLGLVAAALCGGLVAVARGSAATVTGPLRRLSGQVRALGREEGLGGADPAPDEDEVAALAQEFAALTARLDLATARWRREAEERARVELAVLRERNRIAAEVHDTLAQGFMAILLLAEGGRGRLGQVAAVARQGLRQARQSMVELAPVPGAGAGGESPFVRTVREEVRAFTESLRDPVQAAVEVSRWPELPLPQQVALLGVLRGALGNVREHSGARRVRVALCAPAEGGALLEVADDGAGFDPEGLPAHSAGGRGRGLGVMHRRMQEVGGHLSIETKPGGGTRIRAGVPPPKGGPA